MFGLRITVISLILLVGILMPQSNAYNLDDVFRPEYSNPIIADSTPSPWIPGLKYYLVHDKDAKRIEAGNEMLIEGEACWIVTSTGKKFRGDEIVMALKEIGYSPSNETEAIFAAKRIALMQEPHEGRELDKKNSNDYQIPKRVRRQVYSPKVAKKNGYYEVILFGYLRANAGFPQEWVVRYKVLVGKDRYQVKERKLLWTEEGRYSW